MPLYKAGPPSVRGSPFPTPHTHVWGRSTRGSLGRKMGQRHMRLLNRKNLSNLGEFIEPYGREISLASRSGKDQIEQMVSLKNKTAIL